MRDILRAMWEKGHSGGGNGGAVVEVPESLRERLVLVRSRLKEQSWSNTWARAAREMDICQELLSRIVRGRIVRVRVRTLAALERWVATHDATGQTAQG